MASAYGASEDTVLIRGNIPHRRGPGQPGTPNSRTSTSWALRILGIAACVGLFLTIAYIPGGISEPRSSATRLGGTSSSAVTHAKSKKWAHGYDEDEYFELPDDLEAAIAELIIDDDLIASLGAARDDEIIPGVEPRIEGTTDEGVVVSTKGGQNTTLLRIKMLQEMQEAEDINTETESNQQEFSEQCAVDEGSLAIPEPDFSAFEAFENHLIEMHEGQVELSALNDSMAGLGWGWGNYKYKYKMPHMNKQKKRDDDDDDDDDDLSEELREVINTEFCWKSSYGRGVGTIPTTCPPGKERMGFLCYDKCDKFTDAQYKRGGVGDCHQKCTAGYHDHGMLCHKGNHGRGWGSSHCGWYRWSAVGLGEPVDANRRQLLGNAKTKLVCAGPECRKRGLDSCGWLCYPPCPSSHPRKIGCNLCGVSCSEYAGGSVPPSCMKKVKFSPGMQSPTCSDNKEYDAGLCYNKCRDGYRGVGPVCWGQPPIVNGRRWVNCGFGAANSDAACGEVITSQILGPLEMVAFVASAGTSSIATTGPKSAARMAAKLSKTFKGSKVKMMQDASKSLKKSTKKTLKEMEPEDAAEFSSGIDTLLSSQTETEAVQAAAELAAMVDPTGVSSTIAAFAWDTCDKMHGTG